MTFPPLGLDLDAQTTLRGDSIQAAIEQLEAMQLAEALRSSGGIPIASTNARPAETVPLAPPPLPASMSPPPAEQGPSEDLFELPIEEPSQEGQTLPALSRPQFETAEKTDLKAAKPRSLPPARGGVRPRPVPTRVTRRRDLTRREEPPIVQAARRDMRADATTLDMPALNGAVLTDIPVLASDESTVVFSSAAQYSLQHRTNIVHGAIVVRSAPIPIGTLKTLHIFVPGRSAPYTVRAKVILSTEDSIGLSIDEFDAHAEALERLADL
jgi:hypothetical protein